MSDLEIILLVLLVVQSVAWIVVDYRRYSPCVDEEEVRRWESR